MALSEVTGRIKAGDSMLVTALLVAAALHFARDAFVPLALAGLLAFLLTPAANWLERLRIRRTPAALIVILLCLAGSAGLTWGLVGQIYNLAVDLPQYQTNVTTKIDNLHLHTAGRLGKTIAMLSVDREMIVNGGPITPSGQFIHSHRRAVHTSSKQIGPPKTTEPVPVKIEQPEESMASVAGSTITPLTHLLATFFLIAIFLVFMLIGRQDLLDRLLQLTGRGRMQVTTASIEDASRRVSRYLRMQLIVNLLYGSVVGLSLWAIGLPNPLLWGSLTCLLRFIPYVGILTAAAGPLILSIAISPDWTPLLWTMLLYATVEIATANFIEPLLYGVSTGISPIGVLVAAIFWTLLWGFPGLLLSTPLTVCLVVIGRQVPQLRFIKVLFGEEGESPPAERIYQRLIAANTRGAVTILEGMLKLKPIEEVYDTAIAPALALIEEGRYAEELTSARADELFHAMEDLAEEIPSGVADDKGAEWKRDGRIVFVPARALADEVACQLAQYAFSKSHRVRVMPADISTAEMLQTLQGFKPDAVCVLGIPPYALRHLRMRCRQIRETLPELDVIACLLSDACDLPKLRSRIPPEDAQHVACSLQMMKEYLASLTGRPMAPGETSKRQEEQAMGEAVEIQPDVLDGPKEDVFNQLAVALAHVFDAPIALICATSGQRRFWEAECGLTTESFSTPDARRLCSSARTASPNPGFFVIDAAEDERFANDPFFKDRGIRLFAGAPVRASNGTVIGWLTVLDTRPQQASDQQRETLLSIAGKIERAIELNTLTEEEQPLLEA